MKINRRDFLKTTAMTSLYFAGFGLPSFASQNKKNLVIIMLQGGMDGLCAVPVKDDKNFQKLRSKINLDKTLKLTSDFDLHPALENFKSLWDQNKASVFHATSIPYQERSHFEGQNLMMTGGRVPYKHKTGWLGRGMKLAGLTGNGLALSLPMPLLIRGVPLNDNYYPIYDESTDSRFWGEKYGGGTFDNKEIQIEFYEVARNLDMDEIVSIKMWTGSLTKVD